MSSDAPSLTAPLQTHNAMNEPARAIPWRLLALLAFALAGVVLLAAMLMQPRPGTPFAAASPKGLPPSHPAVGGGAAPGPAASAPHALEPGQIQAMAQRLAERLARQPDDADGWAMLARTHALSGQHTQAVEAFRKAEKLRPADAVLLADFADALAMTQQRQLSGEPLALVQRALKVDPVNLKALSLAGTEAFDRGDFPTAVRHWEALQAAGGPDSVFVQQVQGGLIDARTRAGLVASPVAPQPMASGVKVRIGSKPGP